MQAGNGKHMNDPVPPVQIFDFGIHHAFFSQKDGLHDAAILRRKTKRQHLIHPPS